MKRSLVYSILLHLVALLCLLWGIDTRSPSATPQNIEVETVSQTDFEKLLKKSFKDKQKQIVQIDETLSSDDAPDENTKEKIYYSSKNQRTDTNTRAANVGEFRNVLKSAPQGASPKEASVNNLFSLTKDEMREPVQEAESAPTTGRLRGPAGENGDGASATDDYLEDVAIGAETILNAKEYRFYGFYKRIRDQLIHHWHNQLKSEVYKLENEGRQVVNVERKTIVRVFLSPAGVLTRIQLLGSSGLSELDRAATEAFRLASPFPHPPRQMLNEDNQVTIRWEFVVVSHGSSPVQLKVQRTGYR